MTDQTMTPEQALEWLEGLRNTTGDQLCAEIEAGKAAETAQAFRTALEAAREDAERWRFVRRKLCLTGNGNGTCGMQALNLPAAIPGWPEPGKVAEFCDAAIDHAIWKENGDE